MVYDLFLASVLPLMLAVENCYLYTTFPEGIQGRNEPLKGK
jgi:hypothetical protein